MVEASAQTMDLKPVSPMAEVEYADFAAERWARLEFTEAEIECINQGTNEITQDWT